MIHDTTQTSRSTTSRIVKHLREGTLISRIRSKMQDRAAQRAHQKREMEWERIRKSGQPLDATVVGGALLRLDMSSELCKLIYCDNFEEAEQIFVSRFLHEGDVFLDVGANIGLFTLVAAKRVGKTGKVHAFEPCSGTFERLKENVARNAFDNVSCHHMALSDTEGSIELMSFTDGFDAWNSIAAVPHKGAVGSREQVQCSTIDKFVSGTVAGKKVALAKIDVEGWESHVIAGGPSVLKETDAPTLLVEFTEDAAKAAGSSCRELYETLTSSGYGLYTYDATANRLIPDPLRDSYPWVNLIATKSAEDTQRRLNQSASN